MSWFTSTWMGPSVSLTGRIGWAVIAPKVWLSHQPKTQPHTLWKRRAVEKPKSRLFPRAWESRPRRGIPTFPQRRRLRFYEKTQKPKPDISLATKSGHFDLLRTAVRVAHDSGGIRHLKVLAGYRHFSA